MLRRCVWSTNIKNGCSIYIYDISRLRIKHQDIPNNFDDGYIYSSLLYVTSRCPKLRDFKLHSFSMLKFTRQKKLTCSSHRVQDHKRRDLECKEFLIFKIHLAFTKICICISVSGLFDTDLYLQHRYVECQKLPNTSTRKRRRGGCTVVGVNLLKAVLVTCFTWNLTYGTRCSTERQIAKWFALPLRIVRLSGLAHLAFKTCASESTEWGQLRAEVNP